MNRHLTVSIYIVHQNKTLLHLHKKLGMWLPVGGHVDPNESLDEAALRETKEEAGLDVELFCSQKPLFDGVDGIRTLVPPIHVENVVITDDHEHIDGIFYARATTFNLRPLEGETMEIGWYTKEELETLPLARDVKAYALEAFQWLD